MNNNSPCRASQSQSPICFSPVPCFSCSHKNSSCLVNQFSGLTKINSIWDSIVIITGDRVQVKLLTCPAMWFALMLKLWPLLPPRSPTARHSRYSVWNEFRTKTLKASLGNPILPSLFRNHHHVMSVIQLCFFFFSPSESITMEIPALVTFTLNWVIWF